MTGARRRSRRNPVVPPLVGINLEIELTKVLTRIGKKAFTPYYLDTLGNFRLESRLRSQVQTGDAIEYDYSSLGSFTGFEFVLVDYPSVAAKLWVETYNPNSKSSWSITHVRFPNDEHKLWTFMRWAIAARFLNRSVLLRAIYRDDRSRGTNFADLTRLSL